MMKYLLILLYLMGCSGNKPTEKAKAPFEIKIGKVVTGTPLDGGVTLMGISPDGTDEFFTDLNEQQIGEIPFGSWTLYLVGFTGPSPWQGTKYCGQVVVNISLPEESVNVTLTEADCANTIYADVLAAKFSSFDNAIFGQSTFAP